jgi:hypothetical protein
VADDRCHPRDVRADVAARRVPTGAAGEALGDVADDDGTARAVAEDADRVHAAGTAASGPPEVDAAAG